MFQQPAFHLLALSGENDAIPVGYAGALMIFAHQVGLLIEHLNRTIWLGAFELEGGKTYLSFHLLVYQSIPNPVRSFRLCFTLVRPIGTLG